jgi:hypothetical protein
LIGIQWVWLAGIFSFWERGWSEKMLREFWIKVWRLHVILPGLAIGILMGLLVTAPFRWKASVPTGSKPGPTSFDLAHLSPTELETLAFDVLTALSKKKRGPAATMESESAGNSLNKSEDDEQLIHLGMKNARRLLPLARKLTLECLSDKLKTTRLSREKRLVALVKRIVLDQHLGGTAEVREDDLSIIHIGPDYAADLTSDDDAMLLLGHELMHVAVRTGGLKDYIEKVNEGALNAGLVLDEDQQEELACDLNGAEVLKRFISLHPTEETNKERFSRAFGYEPPDERLTRAWQDFCASYNGSPLDDEHLSQGQTLRVLHDLEPELKALIPEDAFSPQLCH